MLASLAEPLVAALLLLAALAFCAAAWLWGPALLAARRRRRVLRHPFPAAWRDILRRRMPAFQRLPAALQLQLKRHVQVLLAEKPFIGCDGLEVTDEMRVLIAAQAALLLLNRQAGYFPNLRQVLVYPGAFVVRRSTVDAAGVTQDARRVLTGESWQQGQVILAWDAVLEGAAQPDDGHNVVIHEFAHQLDQENGRANGAPWLGRQRGPTRQARWAAVLGEAHARLREAAAQGVRGLLDPYGASDPAEFFAVASEVFFEQPVQLAGEEPALYRELAQFYRVDPSSW
jgi:Mlc titration factor MtfA (ptsG expression regulator)